MTSLYDPRDAADISRLIAGYPLAWLVSRDFHASPLPLIAETDANGAVTALFGHCARRNPLVADFRTDPRGLILFTGPQAYVPTALLSKPDWAPTSPTISSPVRRPNRWTRRPFTYGSPSAGR